MPLEYETGRPRCFYVIFKYLTEGGELATGTTKAMSYARAEFKAEAERMMGREARIESISHPHWDFALRESCRYPKRVYGEKTT